MMNGKLPLKLSNWKFLGNCLCGMIMMRLNNVCHLDFYIFISSELTMQMYHSRYTTYSINLSIPIYIEHNKKVAPPCCPPGLPPMVQQIGQAW